MVGGGGGGGQNGRDNREGKGRRQWGGGQQGGRGGEMRGLTGRGGEERMGRGTTGRGGVEGGITGSSMRSCSPKQPQRPSKVDNKSLTPAFFHAVFSRTKYTYICILAAVYTSTHLYIACVLHAEKSVCTMSLSQSHNTEKESGFEE